MTTTLTASKIIIEQIHLEFREGSSDKVYEAKLVETPYGFLVDFAYGRRNTVLKHGTKTPNPTSKAEATKIYDQLVKEKAGKGYISTGTKTSSVVKSEPVASPVQVREALQHSTDTKKWEAVQFLLNSNYAMQEKMDGERRKVNIKWSKVDGIFNKKGLPTDLQSEVALELSNLSNCELDGELVGNHYYIFDCLSSSDKCLRNTPFRQRIEKLNEIWLCTTLLSGKFNHVSVVPTAFTEEEKNYLYSKLVSKKAEGVVFKEINSSYTPGKPASAGDHRKFKFVETASVRVKEQNSGKRSVLMEVLEDGKWIEVGNVTIPANHDIPSKGVIVEVRYLYAYKGGSLFQPVYLKQREDVDAEECTVTQLKFKEVGE